MLGQGIYGNGLLECCLQELVEECCCLVMIIDGIVVGIWEWNVQIGEMWVNVCWVEIVGYCLEELEFICQKMFLKLVYFDDIVLFDVVLDDYF